MARYEIRFSKSALKEFVKLDKGVQRVIQAWLKKNLLGTTDPRAHGKGLMANYSGYWRYRVGNYRLIAVIKEHEVVIEIIAVGHRRMIYKPKK